MIKRHKAFDCVEMKWEIQQKIADEFAGFPDRKIHDIQRERIAKNPILGKFVKRVRVIKTDSLTSS